MFAANEVPGVTVSARLSKLFDTICQNEAAEMIFLGLIPESEKQNFEQYLSNFLVEIMCDDTVEYLDQFGSICSERTRHYLELIGTDNNAIQDICDTLLTKCVWATTIAWFEPAPSLRKDHRTGQMIKHRSTKGCLPCLTRTGMHAYNKTLLHLFQSFGIDLENRYHLLYMKHKKVLDSLRMLDWKDVIVSILFEMHKRYWLNYYKPDGLISKPNVFSSTATTDGGPQAQQPRQEEQKEMVYMQFESSPSTSLTCEMTPSFDFPDLKLPLPSINQVLPPLPHQPSFSNENQNVISVQDLLMLNSGSFEDDNMEIDINFNQLEANEVFRFNRDIHF